MRALLQKHGSQPVKLLQEPLLLDELGEAVEEAVREGGVSDEPEMSESEGVF